MYLFSIISLAFLSVLNINAQENSATQPEAEIWPTNQQDLNLGQISGVDVDKYGNVHVFHRGVHVWDAEAFDSNGNYLQKQSGPIQTFTMLTFDPRFGQVLQRRGANRFYMPHGLTVDKDDNVWVTDVAMHQVFKLGPQGDEPLLVLGKAFKQSSGQDGFCQPTDVAVVANGDVFVSDGYCNSRVVKFSSTGKYLTQFGQATTTWPPAPGQLRIPHDLTLIDSGKSICVADRENQRIQCFDTQSGQVTKTSGNLDRTFALVAVGEQIYGVSQPGLEGGSPSLFMTDLALEPQAISSDLGLENPHDIASDGQNYLYVAEIGPNRLVRVKI